MPMCLLFTHLIYIELVRYKWPMKPPTDEQICAWRAQRQRLDGAGGHATPAQLLDQTGGVRSVGGTTTTLSLGLGLLQSQGEIRRVPVNGRIDQQRYSYARWSPSPLAKIKMDDAQLARELATRFFKWAAPATAAQLAWWAGLGVK